MNVSCTRPPCTASNAAVACRFKSSQVVDKWLFVCSVNVVIVCCGAVSACLHSMAGLCGVVVVDFSIDLERV